MRRCPSSSPRSMQRLRSWSSCNRHKQPGDITQVDCLLSNFRSFCLLVREDDGAVCTRYLGGALFGRSRAKDRLGRCCMAATGFSALTKYKNRACRLLRLATARRWAAGKVRTIGQPDLVRKSTPPEKSRFWPMIRRKPRFVSTGLLVRSRGTDQGHSTCPAPINFKLVDLFRGNDAAAILVLVLDTPLCREPRT